MGELRWKREEEEIVKLFYDLKKWANNFKQLETMTNSIDGYLRVYGLDVLPCKKEYSGWVVLFYLIYILHSLYIVKIKHIFILIKKAIYREGGIHK